MAKWTSPPRRQASRRWRAWEAGVEETAAEAVRLDRASPLGSFRRSRVRSKRPVTSAIQTKS
eukprot:5600889-Prymnesium_polylepis.1